MSVRTIFFDLGETLISEERMWAGWAKWLDVPSSTLFALLGRAIERGEGHQTVFEIICPAFDLARERDRRRQARDYGYMFEAADFYPDALRTLVELRAAGYRTGVAGNHPAEYVQRLKELGAAVDFVGSSEEFGAEKPAPEFFAGLLRLARAVPGTVAYVGDRLDNDVLPAKAAGLVAIFLRRGPWGYIHALRPEAARADIQLRSLADLLPALRNFSESTNASG